MLFFFYETQVAYLYRLAEEYRGSQEADTSQHPFHRQTEAIKTRFAACLPLLAENPDRELSDENRLAFESELGGCLIYGKPLPKHGNAGPYIKPAPFHDEQGLAMFYLRLTSNHQIKGGQVASRETQIHDAAMALRASSFYQDATPEMQRAIQHATEDLVSGVGPDHCEITRNALRVGVGMGASILLSGIFTVVFVEVGFKGVLIVGGALLVPLVLGYGTHAYLDYSTHADVVRLRMYDYPPIECDAAIFGENSGTDKKCFGYTAFDLGAGLYEGFPDAPQSEHLRLIHEYPNHVIR